MQSKQRGVFSFPMVRSWLIVVVCIVASGLAAFVWMMHLQAHAMTLSEYPTTLNPQGMVLDRSGHIWVSEPGCTMNPLCQTAQLGVIGEYSVADGQKIHDFAEPAGSLFSSPAFLALDQNENIWFTEPNSDAIGEFMPATNSWKQWNTSRGAVPYGLLFDEHGNLWFSEIKGNKIGFLNPTTHTIVENALPSSNAQPAGLAKTPDGTIWFTEHAQPQIGSFQPTSSGVLSQTTITEYTVTARPDAIAADQTGALWYSEGDAGSIGEFFPATGGQASFKVTGCTGASCPRSFIAGIVVDSSGKIWFDDTLQNTLGVFDPHTGGLGNLKIEHVHASPREGLVVDDQNNIWVTEWGANLLAELPGGKLTLVNTVQTGPVSSHWYFADGRVGQGFREYLTIANLSSQPCSATVHYFYTLDGQTVNQQKSIVVQVPAASRVTEPVNRDLALDASNVQGASVSSIVSTDPSSGCTGVMVERPLYASHFHGVSSGGDVLGLTHLSSTYYFADIPTGQGIFTSLTAFNPQTTSTNLTISYYSQGRVVQSQSLLLGAMMRGTLDPTALNLPAHVAASVTATQEIMVERSSYYVNTNGVSGAAEVIGSQRLGRDWLFAEGYTGTGSIENLTIANLDPTQQPADVTITLVSKTGSSQSFPITLTHQSQIVWSVNANNTFSGSSPEVSAEVQSSGGAIIVQREIYYRYQHTAGGQTLSANGVTDVMGQMGPDNKMSYSFAEGYTNLHYQEWLTLQNPTAHTEIIYITLLNGYGRSYIQSVMMVGKSRSTIDITALVQQNLIKSGDDFPAYEVSMSVVTQNSGDSFVAERPLYWNTETTPFVTQGSSDIPGYPGD
ncbi:Vgb family protein [Tengunoibacter tsumagoiensis]|uniref:SMP-30/Gluconolactonase/LRE-like region domain-containing protein n=1 Tax=Tengunoibacter tsumagoiensis TaxID=2014871 RepID=A0A402A3V5_9CHLR|nr:hypothetical protein [Tengunoibacter tsumagoiensis]GCE13830.1 hypothetical protein KTT_36890 [Tengunoibacter tsumagoiensis]